MKLLFVSAFPPARGNLAEYGNYLIDELLKRKEIEKIVVLGNCSENSRKIENRGKLKIIRCWKNDDFFTPIKILRQIKKEKPDIVHFNLHMMNWGKGKVCNFLSAFAPWLSKISGNKTIVTLHNIIETVELKELGMGHSFLNSIGSFIATKFLLSGDKTTVTLKRFISVLSEKYRKKNIIQIPHGTLGRQVRKIKTGGNEILTFGFWRDNKNLPFMIEVFNELKNVKLIVAGDSHPNFPGYLEKVKLNYNSENIEFKGYINENDLRKTFLSSALVVLPYTTATGTSGTVNLAASFGKPVVVTDLPEIRELIINTVFYLNLIIIVFCLYNKLLNVSILIIYHYL